ncbi:phospholipase D-like domain-containing protein [Cerasicoccus fimbriatus]|uniref:phospholipase D-like domain-containing protein n=1 Tax=Cerasicoccus fimbriatus TaxID=3014554 RepID=UPI0022B2E3E3|nr:phospholipase D-like domain-containing protein [Cerasicoccus sp. TK19100]
MADLAQIGSALRQTLADGKISRSELQAVRALLRDAELDARELAILRAKIFDLARDQLNADNALALIDWLEDASKTVLEIQRKPTQRIDSSAYFSPGDDCLNAIIGSICGARRTLDICVFTITDDRIVEAIREAGQRRVAVRIITDNDKARDAGSDIARMSRSGLAIKVDLAPDHMHHKFALIDGERLLTGSYNWTRSAASHNQENLLITNDPDAVKAYTVEFVKLWGALADY